MKPTDEKLGTPFNVNWYVMAQLKPEAWARFDQNLRELRLDPAGYRDMHPENADGWSAWQLWEFMREFGPITDMGPPAPYATEIRLFSEAK